MATSGLGSPRVGRDRAMEPWAISSGKPRIIEFLVPIGIGIVTLTLIAVGALQSSGAWLGGNPQECAPVPHVPGDDFDNAWKSLGSMCYDMWKNPQGIAAPSDNYVSCFSRACTVYCVDHTCAGHPEGWALLMAGAMSGVLFLFFTGMVCLKLLSYKVRGYRTMDDQDEEEEEDEEEGLELRGSE